MVAIIICFLVTLFHFQRMSTQRRVQSNQFRGILGSIEGMTRGQSKVFRGALEWFSKSWSLLFFVSLPRENRHRWGYGQSNLGGFCKAFRGKGLFQRFWGGSRGIFPIMFVLVFCFRSTFLKFQRKSTQRGCCQSNLRRFGEAFSRVLQVGD